MKSSPLAYDVGYGCFFLFALIVLALVGIRLSFTDAEWYGGAGAVYFLLLPFIFIPGFAMLVGILLSIRLWKHWPLGVLAGSTVLLVTGSFIQFGPDEVEMAAAIVYGLGVSAASIWWFVFLRKRYFPSPKPEVKK